MQGVFFMRTMKSRVRNLIISRVPDCMIKNWVTEKIINNSIFILDHVILFRLKFNINRSKRVMSDQESEKVLKKFYFNEQEYIYLSRGRNWLDRNHFDVSIIIPCYKVERYIERCLESVFKIDSKYKVEIIVINDGSPDNTLAIIDNMNLPNNTKVISQDNRGLSAARNKGIEESSGKYIFFLDSDDILYTESFNKAISTLKSGDYDLLDAPYVSFNGLKKQLLNYESVDVEEFFQEYNFELTNAYAWGKFFRRELWLETEFPINYWFEDTHLLYSIFPNVKRYKKVQSPLVEYYINENGITKQADNNMKSLDTLYILEYLLAEVRNKNLLNNKIKEISLVQMSSLLFRRIRFLDEDVQQAAFIRACYYFEKYELNGVYEEKLLNRLNQSFVKRDYRSWKLLSKII
mgnify:CR=1 FL=1